MTGPVPPLARLRRCRAELEDVFRELAEADYQVAALVGLALIDLNQAERRLAAAESTDTRRPTEGTTMSSTETPIIPCIDATREAGLGQRVAVSAGALSLIEPVARTLPGARVGAALRSILAAESVESLGEAATVALVAGRQFVVFRGGRTAILAIWEFLLSGGGDLRLLILEPRPERIQ